VAAAPTAHYSATAQTDLNLRNTGLSVSDVDGGSGIETATLSVGQGIITIAAGDSGISNISGNGTSSVTFSGTIAQINALLNTSTGTVVYNDNAATPGASTIHDNGNTGGGNLFASASSTIDVTTPNTANTIQLIGQSFLGGAGDQRGTSVTYVDGHLYLTYDGPEAGNTTDNAHVVGFNTGLNGATQTFTYAWNYGDLFGVAADGNLRSRRELSRLRDHARWSRWHGDQVDPGPIQCRRYGREQPGACHWRHREQFLQLYRH
jgi:hypothetical protein